jgi:putative PIN family toxin of toxin-antitoxin system
VIVAVLDTNVLASGVAGAARLESTPGELVRRWRARQFTLVLSEPILAELVRTLSNPYFQSRLSPAQIDEALARFSTHATLQTLTTQVSGVATHPQDDLILATALSARAPYLVTGDRPLLELGTFRGVTLLSPREFLAQLAQAGSG